jgi:hypothetical protein
MLQQMLTNQLLLVRDAGEFATTASNSNFFGNQM